MMSCIHILVYKIYTYVHNMYMTVFESSKVNTTHQSIYHHYAVGPLSVASRTSTEDWT